MSTILMFIIQYILKMYNNNNNERKQNFLNKCKYSEISEKWTNSSFFWT